MYILYNMVTKCFIDHDLTVCQSDKARRRVRIASHRTRPTDNETFHIHRLYR